MIAHVPVERVRAGLVAYLEVGDAYAIFRSSCVWRPGGFVCIADQHTTTEVGTAGYERFRFVVRVDARGRVVRVVPAGVIA